MAAAHPLEIELKLALPPGQVEAFRKKMARRRAGRGTRSAPQQQALVTRYFDTPDFDLAARGVALRVRQAGAVWLQTLKTASASHGGLSRRVEFEMPLDGDALDWARFPPEARDYVPEALRAQVRPLFETGFERTTWQVASDNGDRIEVALDLGTIRTLEAPALEGEVGERTLPLCEIELELKAGEPDALFVLALEWAEAFDCVPLDASKAARGIALVRGEVPGATGAQALALDAGMRVEEGFAATCQACLEHFQANLHGLLESDEVEFVHQARVALRRLRAALRLYRGICVPPDELAAVVRELAAALGPARDWDVFCSETLPAIAPHYPDTALWQQRGETLDARRAAVRAEMHATLRAARPGRWLLAMQRWLQQAGWRSDPSGRPFAPAQRDAQQAPLEAFARGALDNGERRIARRARKFSKASAARRHALRIAIKRQRYAAEFFEALFDATGKRRRRRARYVAALREAQDSLGRANDLRTATRLLQEVDAGATGAFALGWLAAQQAGAGVGQSAGPVRAVLKAKTYW
ncbi:CYTH and CHAD domain-containing protein [Thiobacillus denitrificans]|nr:CYTH and CHAD domain-containing protein [Thiobacillus denitrificans]